MNRGLAKNFLSIKSATANYKTAVTKAIDDYSETVEQARERARLYKNEDEVFAEAERAAKGRAREAIKTAQRTFSDAVKAELPALRMELQNHVSAVPDDSFLNVLKMHKDFNIPLTKEDIATLLEKNQGNLLGLRALESTLKSTESNYELKYNSLDNFTKDLKALERVAEGQQVPFWTPPERHTVACDVLGGMRIDEAGHTLDNVGLIIQRSALEGTERLLDASEERWCTGIPPTVEQLTEHYKPRTAEDGTEVTAEEQLAEDRASAAKSAEATLMADLSKAREIVNERARGDAVARAAMNYYVNGVEPPMKGE